MKNIKNIKASEEIIIMDIRMDNMDKKLASIDKKLDSLTIKLLDPDDGFVVRVNKNTEFRKEVSESLSTCEKTVYEFNEIKSWKENVTKALWVTFTAMVGVIVKLMFFNK